jgi:hypothetical protein
VTGGAIEGPIKMFILLISEMSSSVNRSKKQVDVFIKRICGQHYNLR